MWFVLFQSYLKRFGYIETELRSGFQSMVSTAKALKRMQRQMGLEETGELDTETLDAMKKPRCGVVDVGNYKTFDGDLKWDHHDVSYRWAEKINLRFVMTRAPFKEYSDVSNGAAIVTDVITLLILLSSAGSSTILQTWRALWLTTPLPEPLRCGAMWPLWPSLASFKAQPTSWYRLEKPVCACRVVNLIYFVRICAATLHFNYKPNTDVF